VLRRIADRSGGEYFRATDPEALEHVMEQLDPLERREVRINETRDYRELYPWVLGPGLILLAAALTLRAGRLRTLP
jgi:Ca-activated chloride channel family protein